MINFCLKSSHGSRRQTKENHYSLHATCIAIRDKVADETRCYSHPSSCKTPVGCYSPTKIHISKPHFGNIGNKKKSSPLCNEGTLSIPSNLSPISCTRRSQPFLLRWSISQWKKAVCLPTLLWSPTRMQGLSHSRRTL